MRYEVKTNDVDDNDKEILQYDDEIDNDKDVDRSTTKRKV